MEKYFFLIFKIFIEFVTILPLFYGLVFLIERHVGSQLPDQRELLGS